MLTIEQIATNENRKERGFRNGIFDVSNIKEIICLPMEGFHPSTVLKSKKENTDKIVEFCNKYPDWRIGEAHQCQSLFLLSSKPTTFQGKETGSGFNYGSSNLLEDCPAKLLILADD